MQKVVVNILSIFITQFFTITKMSFTAKIDSEKLNDDEIDNRMLANRLLELASNVDLLV